MNTTTSRRLLVAATTVSSFMLTAVSAVAVTWVNETNLPAEADYDNLQFPSSIAAQANTLTSFVYGRVFEASVTPAAGRSALVLADVGYGPFGSDPRTNNSWVWSSASFNIQLGNDDEYQQQILAPAFNGTYSYTYRFSIDSGANYTAADLDGAGSNIGLAFDPNNLGVLIVVDGLDSPEPNACALPAIACLAASTRRWKRT